MPLYPENMASQSNMGPQLEADVKAALEQLQQDMQVPGDLTMNVPER